MTVKDMMPAIGATVMVTFESVKVTCIVTDVKESWGKARVQVNPVVGDGSQWVEMGRVSAVTHTTTSRSQVSREDIERMKRDGYLGAGWTR